MSIFTDSLNSGNIANGGQNITYFFSNDYSAWNSHEITQFENALQQWENVANITFTPAASQVSAEFVFYNTSEAQIRSVLNVPPTAGAPLGAFELPNGSTAQQSSWFNYQATGWDYANTTGGLGQGGYGYITILHEVGHGLGLDHPHDGSPIFPGVTGPFDTGTNNYNQGVNTVMSYNDGLVSNGLNPGTTQGYGWTGTPMAFDIAAIQLMYGANTNFQTGNNTYTLPSSNANGTFYSSIWDAGGIDTIVAQGNANAVINLNDASLVNGDPDAGGAVSASAGIYGGFTIANGAVIENATGAGGNDTLIGNSVNNTIIGGGGSDTMIGGGGNDLFDMSVSNAGDLDSIDGGIGTDTVTFSSFGSAVWANIGSSFWTKDSTDLASGSWRKMGTFQGVEDLVGSNYDDQLIGDIANNTLTGGGGNDTITGGGGSDTMIGDSGNDLFDMSVSNVGDLDSIDGGIGTDTVTFSSFGSAVWANTGSSFWTKDGTDLASGSWRKMGTFQGVEDLVGSNYDDQLIGDIANNTLTGGGGNDTITGGGGSDTMIGDSGNDLFDMSVSNVGDLDSINGGTGTDTVTFSSFGSAVWANVGSSFWTKDSTDLVSGSWRKMGTIQGAEDLIGSNYDDTLIGDIANNTLTGGGGSDTLIGDGGNDIFDMSVSNVGDLDSINGGTGTDTVTFSSFGSAVWANVGSSFWTKDGTDLVSGGWRKMGTIQGAEDLIGSNYDDTLIGDIANNTLTGGGGSDTLIGDGGNDIFDISVSNVGDLDKIDGGIGTDTVTFSAFSSAVWANVGSDFWTKDGTDLISGSWRKMGTFQGVEDLIGSNYDDTLIGDIANNTLTGGGGSDTFVFENNFGNDSILDWQDTGSSFEDLINFSGDSATNSMANLTIDYSTGDAIITTDSGDSITLVGVTSGLDVTDFIF